MTTAEFIQQQQDQQDWQRLRRRLMIREGKIKPKQARPPKPKKQPKKKQDKKPKHPPRTRPQEVWWKRKHDPQLTSYLARRTRSRRRRTGDRPVT